MEEVPGRHHRDLSVLQRVARFFKWTSHFHVAPRSVLVRFPDPPAGTAPPGVRFLQFKALGIELGLMSSSPPQS